MRSFSKSGFDLKLSGIDGAREISYCCLAVGPGLMHVFSPVSIHSSFFQISLYLMIYELSRFNWE